MIAGQHYKYLLRQMTEIRDGKRRNANPDMVKIIKKYEQRSTDRDFGLSGESDDAGKHVQAQGKGGKKK